MNKSIVPDEVRELIRKTPLYVTEAYPYFGTFIRINLADLDKKDITIRIYLCDWVLMEDSKSLATSNSNPGEWPLMVEKLNGGRFLDLIFHNSECLEMVFDAGRSLILKANMEEYDAEDELVVIYVPKEYAISYSPSHGFRRELVG